MHAILDPFTFLGTQFADQTLAGPNTAVPCHIGYTSGLVDGVAKYDKLNARGRMVGAQPLLTFGDTSIQIEFIQPVLADLPVLGQSLHCTPSLLGAGERIGQIVAVRLREKIVNQTVSDVFATGRMVATINRCHSGPYFID